MIKHIKIIKDRVNVREIADIEAKVIGEVDVNDIYAIEDISINEGDFKFVKIAKGWIEINCCRTLK